MLRDGGADMGGRRPRATSEEWRQYYERADRARALLGDPFQKLMERRDLRERLVRVGMKAAAVAAMVMLIWVGIWLLNDDRLDTILNLSHD